MEQKENSLLTFIFSGWILVMCADIYFFKYKKCKKSLDVSIEEENDDFGSTGKLKLITTSNAKFQQSELWC